MRGQDPKVLPQLLKEDEGQDGVGAQPREGRHVALEEGHGALLGGEPDEVEGAVELARLRVHRPRLQHVQGLRHRRGDGALKNIRKV